MPHKDRDNQTLDLFGNGYDPGIPHPEEDFNETNNPNSRPLTAREEAKKHPDDPHWGEKGSQG